MIRVSVDSNCDASFRSSLAEASVEYNNVRLYSHMETGGSVLAIMCTAGGILRWSGLANVLVAWINARSNRRAVLTLSDNTIFEVQGYSVEEVQAMLDTSVNLTILKKEQDGSSSPASNN